MSTHFTSAIPMLKSTSLAQYFFSAWPKPDRATETDNTASQPATIWQDIADANARHGITHEAIEAVRRASLMRAGLTQAPALPLNRRGAIVDSLARLGADVWPCPPGFRCAREALAAAARQGSAAPLGGLSPAPSGDPASIAPARPAVRAKRDIVQTPRPYCEERNEKAPLHPRRVGGPSTKPFRVEEISLPEMLQGVFGAPSMDAAIKNVWPFTITLSEISPALVARPGAQRPDTAVMREWHALRVRLLEQLDFYGSGGESIDPAYENLLLRRTLYFFLPKAPGAAEGRLTERAMMHAAAKAYGQDELVTVTAQLWMRPAAFLKDPNGRYDGLIRTLFELEYPGITRVAVPPHLLVGSLEWADFISGLALIEQFRVNAAAWHYESVIQLARLYDADARLSVDRAMRPDAARVLLAPALVHAAHARGGRGTDVDIDFDAAARELVEARTRRWHSEVNGAETRPSTPERDGAIQHAQDLLDSAMPLRAQMARTELRRAGMKPDIALPRRRQWALGREAHDCDGTQTRLDVYLSNACAWRFQPGGRGSAARTFKVGARPTHETRRTVPRFLRSLPDIDKKFNAAFDEYVANMTEGMAQSFDIAIDLLHGRPRTYLTGEGKLILPRLRYTDGARVLTGGRIPGAPAAIETPNRVTLNASDGCLLEMRDGDLTRTYRVEIGGATGVQFIDVTAKRREAGLEGVCRLFVDELFGPQEALMWLRYRGTAHDEQWSFDDVRPIKARKGVRSPLASTLAAFFAQRFEAQRELAYQKTAADEKADYIQDQVRRAFIPFYGCVQDLAAQDGNAAGLSCSLSILSVLPVAGNLAKLGGMGAAIGSSIMQRALLGAIRNLATVGTRELAVLVAHTAMRPVGPALLHLARHGGRALAVSAIRAVDPGVELAQRITWGAARISGTALNRLSTAARSQSRLYRLSRQLNHAARVEQGRFSVDGQRLLQSGRHRYRLATLDDRTEVPYGRFTPVGEDSTHCLVNPDTGLPFGPRLRSTGNGRLTPDFDLSAASLREFEVKPAEIGPFEFDAVSGIYRAAESGRTFIKFHATYYWVRYDNAKATWRIGSTLEPHRYGQPLRYNARSATWTPNRQIGLRGGGKPDSTGATPDITPQRREQIIAAARAWAQRQTNREPATQLADAVEDYVRTPLPATPRALQLAHMRFDEFPALADWFPGSDTLILAASRFSNFELVDGPQMRRIELTDIEAPSAKIASLPRLETLSLGSPGIGRFDVRLESLPALAEVFIRRMDNVRLVAGQASPALSTLELSSSSLSRHAPNFQFFSGLRNLRLIDNNLSTLPGSMRHLRQLRVLVLNDNPIRVLPNWFYESHPALRQLVACNNGLIDLDDRIANFAHLETLIIRQNHLTALPESMGSLRRLQSLDASNNRLERLPHRIGFCAALRDLNLDANRLTELPASLGSLTNAEVISLSANRLSRLPDTIGNLRNLKRLTMPQNNLGTLPDTIGQLHALVLLQVSNNRLTRLPSALGNLAELACFRANTNALEALPTSIGGLTRLKTLNVANNRIRALPAEIGGLVRLRDLDLADNHLAELPPQLGSLVRLEVLDVSSNALRALPAEMGRLDRLENLILRHNQLAELPREIGQLSNLRRLRLSDNRLTTLPDELGNLQQLVLIDLRNNQLTSVATDLLDRLPGNCRIHLGGNPLSEAFLEHVLARGARPRINLEPPDTGSLIAEVIAWFDDDSAAVGLRRRVWEPFASEPNADSMRVLLSRLRRSSQTNTSADAPLTRTIRKVLDEVARDADFRRIVFDYAEDGCATCTDRVLLTVDKIIVAYKVRAIARTGDDGNAVFRLARGIERERWLEAYADQLVRQWRSEGRAPDAIEVHLKLRIATRERLALPGDINAMHFEETADVTAQMVDDAVSSVHARERQGLRDALARNAIWQDYLKRQNAVDFEQIDAMFDAQMEALDDAVRAGEFDGESDVLQSYNALADAKAEALNDKYGTLTDAWLVLANQRRAAPNAATEHLNLL